MDKHLQRLLDNLGSFAATGDVFDLKDYFAYYVLDVLGELAFSQSFDTQLKHDRNALPPINDHLYLGSLMGLMSTWIPTFNKVAPSLPWPWVQRLFQARKQLKDIAAVCVSRRMHSPIGDRKDLLTSLIKAQDPETGAKLTELEINTEAFAMLLVLLHNPSPKFRNAY